MESVETQATNPLVLMKQVFHQGVILFKGGPRSEETADSDNDYVLIRDFLLELYRSFEIANHEIVIREGMR